MLQQEYRLVEIQHRYNMYIDWSRYSTGTACSQADRDTAQVQHVHRLVEIQHRYSMYIGWSRYSTGTACI
jgi:hypothetical protein